jgi:hypothetical protein
MQINAPNTELTLPSLPKELLSIDLEISNENAKQLYYHIRTKGTKIFDSNKKYLGSHTGYAAIAHDGRSIGQICIKNDEGILWISGMAVYVDNIGIFLV